MPGKKDAEYWRNYRLQKAAEKTQEIAPEQVTKKSPIHVTEKSPMGAEEIPQKASNFKCGCEPGLKCLAHAIQRLTQHQRDAILQNISRQK